MKDDSASASVIIPSASSTSGDCGMVYQDFQNDWTETDVDSELSSATTTVNWGTEAGGGGYERDDTGNFTRDFGAAFFGDLDFAMDFQYVDVEAGDADNRAIVITQFGISNDSGKLGTDWFRFFTVQDGVNDDKFVVRFGQSSGGVLDFEVDSGVLDTGATMFTRMRRSGTSCYLDIYSTAALRTAGGNGDLVDLDDGGNGSNTAYRYGLALQNIGAGVDGADHSSGWMTNVDLAYVPATVTVPVMFHHYMNNQWKKRG
jgi:hypothetical protein